MKTYSFDNDADAAIDRHQYLSAMLDGFTRQRLAGVGDLTGLHCLELGAGGGTIAAWLAEKVGRTGRVLATDLNVRRLRPDDGYDVLRHDLIAAPVPDGPWDLIHARLLLMHLPQRDEVLAKLAAALAPGGVLVIEDWATASGSLVLAAPDARARELVDAYQDALVTTVMPVSGNDPTWARRIHQAMLDAGLVNVDTSIAAESWPGGTPGALLIATNVTELRERFLNGWFTPQSLEELSAVVTDPRLVVRGHLTYSTIGYRPEGRS